MAATPVAFRDSRSSNRGDWKMTEAVCTRGVLDPMHIACAMRAGLWSSYPPHRELSADNGLLCSIWEIQYLAQPV